MADAELDCDVCGMSVDPQHLYQLSVTHGNLHEEFEFCSMACLARWTKQYAEDQRRASAAKLEQSLSADDGTDDGNADLQDLEDEVQESDADMPVGKPYAVRSAPAYADVTGEDDQEHANAAYAGNDTGTPFDDLAASVDEPVRYGSEGDGADADQLGDTPVTDFIEEMDPVEKGKREQEEREQRDREQLQEQHEESGDSQKPA